MDAAPKGAAHPRPGGTMKKVRLELDQLAVETFAAGLGERLEIGRAHV